MHREEVDKEIIYMFFIIIYTSALLGGELWSWAEHDSEQQQTAHWNRQISVCFVLGQQFCK